MENLSPQTYHPKPAAGFTLIETLIAMALFVMVGYAIFFMSANVLETISRNKWRAEAVAVLQNEIETVRNMNYADVGILGGAPAGWIAAKKTVYSKALKFTVTATVRNIDDPFDGTLGGEPNDTAPADYKLVEFEAVCENCPTGFGPIVISTRAAPPGLETTTNNGSLFINVFDAFGAPVSEADVHVFNGSASPTVTIDDETNVSGELQLVDIPTSTQAYEITVTKSGYSSEQTYEPGEPENPNPVKPHATVVGQGITEVSFAIDRVSTLEVTASDYLCATAPSIDFDIRGAKLIGTAPDVLKYAASSTTDGSGSLTIFGLEWDTYTVTNTDAIYDLGGSTIISPFLINPNTANAMRWLMEPADPSALLVVVEDAGGAFVPDTTVRLEGPGGYDKTLTTEQRNVTHTDWSGGAYSSKGPDIETDAVSGQISLAATGSPYPTTTTSTLVSETFDFGTSSTDLGSITWNPTSQPPETGGNSVRFQIASNNDDATWNYVGPDGTSGTYYASSNSTLHTSHDGDRYLRYELSLDTEDTLFSPTIEDVSFDFSSGCIPTGQAYFGGLAGGTYTLTVSKSGYQTFSDSAVSIGGSWQEYRVTLTP